MEIWMIPAGLGIAAVAGSVCYVLGRNLERKAEQLAGRSAKDVADRHLADARKEAEAYRQTQVTSGKEELAKSREALESESQRRRDEIAKGERRVEERDKQLERKVDLTERRERDLETKLTTVAALEQKVSAQEQELRQLAQEQHRRLEALAGLTSAEAKRELLRSVEDEAKAEAAQLIRSLKEQAKRDADKEAKKIVALAIQRIAADQTSETVISAVTLPNDEMKGRIIGREGPQHPRLRAGDRRGRDHRRHPGRRDGLVLRSGAPRSCAALPRTAHQRRPHSPRAHRGGGEEGPGRRGHADPGGRRTGGLRRRRARAAPRADQARSAG